MLDELQQRAEQAAELCKAAGASDAWVKARRERSVEFTTRDGKLEKVQESTTRSLTVEIYAEERYSTHTTTDLRPERLQSFLQEAVALTGALQADPHRKIPDPALFEGRSDADLELVDGGLASISQQQREQWCVAMDEGARADERVISASSTVEDSHYQSAMVSSNGFSGAYESTSIWFVSQTTVQDEGDRRPVGYQYMGARHLDSLPDPAALGGEALRYALLRLGAVKGPTGRKTVVVDPRAAGSLLRRFLRPARAEAIQQGRSFWGPLLGQRVASEKLSIVDDPLLPRGFGSRLFDSEGIAARAFPIVEAGVARNVYVDTYYGRKADMAPTTGGSSNQVVALGDRTLEQLLADADGGIYVTGWLGGNADGTTGDFSLGLEGHLIEGGKPGAPVGEMNATGNLVELFGNLVALGDEPWKYSSLLAPALVFQDVQISGA